jgi:hypothetical protein
MGVDLRNIYKKVAEAKRSTRKGVFVKVNKYGAVLGVNGTKEKVENVIKNLYANKRDIIDISKLDETDLSKYHLIIIGSQGKKDPAFDKLKNFVQEGGFLVTTDKSLDTIVAELFPDTITYKKEEIKGGAIKGEFSNMEHPFVRGASKKKVLKFWVEDKSHPITKKKPGVKSIVTSKKLKKKYDSEALMVALKFGDGMIVHMLPKLHPEESNEQGHYVSAHIVSNILDEAVIKMVPDEIRAPTNPSSMAYINMVLLKDPTINCVFCGSSFQDYEDKVYMCGACQEHYHKFCVEQQLARDGTCSKCGRVMIFENFKSDMEAAAAPQTFQPPDPPPEPETKKEEKKEEVPPPPPE